MTEKLVVLDFSGTLCLAAPRFAAPAALHEELAKSGLAALGVTSEVFWSELVNPTWTAGSTTRAGYRRVLTERLANLTPQASRDDVARSVSRFSNAYFQANSVDPLWSAFLGTCVRQAGLAAVIATDHYAEATEAVLASLAGIGIPGRSVEEAPLSPPGEAVLVANSADLGTHKSGREFWEALRRRMNCPELKGILLVDDFGINEPEGDAYGASERVIQRKAETTARLVEVFQAPVSCFFFSLRPAPGEPGEIPAAARIDEALGALKQFLAA
ncbi:MAG: hypothetical protein HPY65_11260 [Syntrophaceae bacterium]|nr:hypothetical protein [Syntrophaceae bacterium]